MVAPTAAQKRHWDRVVSLGCMICKRMGIDDSVAEIHHARCGQLGVRNHDKVLPICPQHHRLGDESIHRMGRKAFARHYGFTEADLLADVERMLAK